MAKRLVIKDKYKGILFIIMAGFFFSLMTFFVRLSGDLPTMQKAFFRNAVAAVVAIAMLMRTEEKFKIKKSSCRESRREAYVERQDLSAIFMQSTSST